MNYIINVRIPGLIAFAKSEKQLKKYILKIQKSILQNPEFNILLLKSRF